MARFEPNFFDDDQREPWTVIRFGSGAPIKAALTKINGVSTKHKWKEQKSKEKSGSVNVFSGTEWGHPELTFEAVDEEDFDDLRALWDLMKPVPGQGGTPTPTPAPGQTYAIGSPAKADSGSTSGSSSTGSSSGATASGGTSSSTDTDSSSKSSSAAKDNPGPRPPTISVHHPALAWHDITACALEEWEGPTPTDTNALEVKLKIIPDKPPAPAGTGAMAAPADPGSQFSATGGAGGTGGTSGGSSTPTQKANTNAANGAAGT